MGDIPERGSGLNRLLIKSDGYFFFFTFREIGESTRESIDCALVDRFDAFHDFESFREITRGVGGPIFLVTNQAETLVAKSQGRVIRGKGAPRQLEGGFGNPLRLLQT